VPKSLLDTSAYIDFQRARKHRREAWAANTLRHVAGCIALQGKLCMSTPTVMEIVHGLTPPASRQVFRDQIMPAFEILVFEESAACLAGEIYARLERARQRIGISDTQVAAIAITRGLTLATSNSKHFQRVVDLGFPLELENWRDA
jgi:predicted nucleic acid-binding protein